MRIFNKKNQYQELDTFTFGMASDALDAVKIVDQKMQQFDDDSPLVNGALVFIPGYALGLFLMMLTDSYAKRELGNISNTSQDIFMQTINEKFTKAILNILVYGKHTTKEAALMNCDSILKLARAYYGRVVTNAVESGGDILANMIKKAPLIMVKDVIDFAHVEEGSSEADVILNIANTVENILQKRYEDKWLIILQKKY